jgi:hypothetical protein
MRISKILFCLICLLASRYSTAQTNFLKGYYISAENDTVHGYIEYAFDSRNYRLCVYKADLNADPVNLHPTDIRGFAIQDKLFYERHSFKSRKGDGVSGFFEVLFKGKVSLLRYESRYFAQNDEEGIVEISKRREVIEGNKVKDDYRGMGLLLIMMKDCARMTAGFLEKNYKSNPDFENIFEEYYKCTGHPVRRSTRPGIRLAVNFGLQAAATLPELSFASRWENATFDSQLGYNAGGFLSIFFPRVNESFRLVVEATYSAFDGYSFFAQGSSNNDLFLEYSMLRVPIIIRYSPKRFFVDIGLQNQYILDQQIRWRIEALGNNVVETTDGSVNPLPSLSNGFLIGAGYRFNHLRSSVRFSQTASPDHQTEPVYRSIELLLSYQF